MSEWTQSVSRVARRFLRAMQGGFLYHQAGKGAQPEVKQAIVRFRQLPVSERAEAVSLWGWLLGDDGTPPYKPTKADVGYVDHEVDEQNCGNCNSAYEHVTSGTFICDRMEGPIEPEAWCQRWNEPWDPQKYREYQGD